MSEILKHPNELTNSEVQAIFSTLTHFSEQVQRSKSGVAPEQADSQIMASYQDALEHTKNSRVSLFLAAGAAGSARAQFRQPLEAEFFQHITRENTSEGLRVILDNFSRSVVRARQNPDGDEAIAFQGHSIVQHCLGELGRPDLSVEEKDVLFATVFYAVAQAGPGSPAQQTAQTNLPPLR